MQQQTDEYESYNFFKEHQEVLRQEKRCLFFNLIKPFYLLYKTNCQKNKYIQTNKKRIRSPVK
jgi:hypothetical protein